MLWPVAPSKISKGSFTAGQDSFHTNSVLARSGLLNIPADVTSGWLCFLIITFLLIVMLSLSFLFPPGKGYLNGEMK